MNAAVIVAGGSGLRMGAQTRKQYLSIGGVPILARTVSVFAQCPDIGRIILVVPENDFDFCTREILGHVNADIPVDLAPGGKVLRQESVANGLDAAGPETDIVAIHDGVRPFVDPQHIRACLRQAQEHGACILGVPAFDTLKQVDGQNNISATLDRKNIWLAQTPQAFQYSLIRQAHQKALEDGFQGTDDASLVERLGRPVRIIPGSRANIKITTPGDLALAQAMLAAREAIGDG